MRLCLTALCLAALLPAADPNPIKRVWRINPEAGNPALRAVLPEVHAVRTDGSFLHMESAGLALQSLAPLDVNAIDPAPGVRHFDLAFPLAPKRGSDTPTPLGIMGAFVNGVPIYNITSAVSWRDQNLWHQDAIAAAPRLSPLVAAMLGSREQGPLIGFALDGFPIYGRTFRSSYRIRALTKRDRLPDGTVLGPSQEGPPVTPQYPLGTFVEDYEYVPGSGDLDEHNGRFARTAEYPEGTYAYFLATDQRGQLAYPYLIGATYYGAIERPATPAGQAPVAGDPSIRMTRKGESLVFAVTDTQGRRIRFLEKVHEKPIHLAIVSDDLADFAHIHPELQPDDTFAVSHHFPHGGKYWLYADYTMPGKPQSISRFQLDVSGPKRVPPTSSTNAVRVSFHRPPTIRAGEDIEFGFVFSATDLEPYLGAWAHLMIVSADGKRFIHAHPIDDGPPTEDPWKHTHTAPGPSPANIRTVTGFEQPGKYRMWLQFQREGQVTALPFTVKVAPRTRAKPPERIPADAIRIKVSRAGFEPARIEVPAGKIVRLAFSRDDAENCASSVVFPDLNLRKELPAGRTTLLELPQMHAGELNFSCGMKMYRGSLMVQAPR